MICHRESRPFNAMTPLTLHAGPSFPFIAWSQRFRLPAGVLTLVAAILGAVMPTARAAETDTASVHVPAAAQARRVRSLRVQLAQASPSPAPSAISPAAAGAPVPPGPASAGLPLGDVAVEEAPTTAARFVQTGFDAPSARREFETWRSRFENDMDEFQRHARRNRSWSQGLLLPDNTDGIRQVFKHSIDDSPKGLALRTLLVQATVNTDRRVYPLGGAVAMLAQSPQTQPVGWGGEYQDDGQTVELWYMLFDDVSHWSESDFQDSLAFGAFDHPRLPAYRSLQRNVWPALVFSRADDGSLRLHGVSMELRKILDRIFAPTAL
jgi:hypothetical protein